MVYAKIVFSEIPSGKVPDQFFTSLLNKMAVVCFTASNTNLHLPLHFDEAVKDLITYQAVAEWPPFGQWLASYSPKPTRRFELSSVTIHEVRLTPDGQHLQMLRFTPVVVRTSDGITLESQTVTVTDESGGGAAILVLLRTMVVTSQNGSRPREFVAFVRTPRVTVGAPYHREIVRARLTPSTGRFVGPAVEAVEKACQIALTEEACDDLTSLALSATTRTTNRSRRQARSLGVAPIPEQSPARIRIFLYRQSVDMSFVNKLRSNKPSLGMYEVDVVPLGDAWHMTTDAIALSGLLLLHELRYYSLMPRLRRKPATMDSAQLRVVTIKDDDAVHPGSTSAGSDDDDTPTSSASHKLDTTINQVRDGSGRVTFNATVMSPVHRESLDLDGSHNPIKVPTVQVADHTAQITVVLKDAPRNIPDGAKWIVVHNGLPTLINGRLVVLVDTMATVEFRDFATHTMLDSSNLKNLPNVSIAI